jgi:hypothetical protein
LFLYSLELGDEALISEDWHHRMSDGTTSRRYAIDIYIYNVYIYIPTT